MPSYSGIWSLPAQMQARAAGNWTAPPDAPTIGTATGGDTQASVAFTAPTYTGNPAGVTGYTVTSSPGGFTGTGASSPIVVTGLTNGVSYTFTVTATGASGVSAPSAVSNSVVPAVQGQQAYTTAGTYSWVAPSGVTSVSVVAVGGGGGTTSTRGAGGGELRYKNNISVIPGNSYTVVVSLEGTYVSTATGDASPSTFNSTTVIANGGFGGNNSGNGGSGGTGDGGGNGGNGAGPGGSYGSGGGAGGYAGAGGNGANNGSPQAGSGGGGGGGGSYQPSSNYLNGAAGGGVGLLGQGSNGAAGSNGSGGGGGSGGTAGSNNGGPGGRTLGGSYGGGAGAANGSANTGGNGGSGAVRIIWPGDTRQFPSTNTGDV